MDSNIAILIIGAMIFGLVIHAYNMGWQAGHDVHHDEPLSRPPAPPTDPSKTLYS